MSTSGTTAMKPLSVSQTAQPAESAANQPPASAADQQSQLFPGSGVMVSGEHRVSESSANEHGDITLNFINTDIRDVAKAILGDYLKLNYEIAANVQGAVTIQTSRPLTRAQVMPVLEQVLRLNNLALTNTDGVYKVVALAEARHQSGAIEMARSKAALGYGIEVVPVHYISAAEMEKLLDPLAPSQGIIHVDTSRNVLIIEGTEEERQTLLDDIALFDADWLSGMSFALFTPSYMDAEELTKELDQVIGGLDSPVSGVVRLVPIDRLNTVLAVSPQARYLNELKSWVERLDRPGEGSDKKIYVYHVQNGRASDVAATLGKVLFGNGGSAQTPSHQGESPAFQSSTAFGSSNTALPSLASSSGTPSPVSNTPPPPPTTGSASADSGSKNGIAGFESVSITSDEVNNALVIACSPKQYTSIIAALDQLDKAPVQVFLEAAIAEVTLTNNMQYGLQYFYQPSGNHEFVLSNTGSSAIGAAFPGFAYFFTNGTNIQVVLNALATETHVEVVSSPKVLVLNNQTATLQVGDQVPIATEQATSVLTPDAPVVNSIQYQPTGVILQVTPRVNRGGIVMMDVSQEVSDVSSTTTSALNSPTISQRKIASSVAVQDGETIALGGLILSNINKSKNGIPFLQDVPVLGNLFRTTENDTSRTELMVLITPHVIDNVQKARAITDELRRRLPTLQPLLEDAH
ncbi:MAG TPA: type II secretion system secretin GspD [Rhizomicrobium sp.]|nr:type II secretion system secretin GspD [Rhizomicrobium sp.]